MLFKETIPIEQRHRSGDQSSLVDRIWIEKTYLPSLYGSVLYVGVSNYTDFYHELVRDPKLFVTVDMNPDVAKYGSPFEHYIDTIQDYLDGCNRTFDHISIFGLFGQKHSVVQDKRVIKEIIDKCVDHVNPKGTLHLGFNDEVIKITFPLFIESSKIRELHTKASFICRPSQAHSNVFMYWGEK